MKKYSFKYVVKIALLLISTIGNAYLYFLGEFYYATLLTSVLIYLAIKILSQERKLLLHIKEFSDAAYYHDFTRRYWTSKKNTVEKELFDALNQINSVFNKINNEKEIQHQYLIRVINMLEFSLIFYHQDSGKIIWVNDAFKKTFDIPHVAKISTVKKRLPDLYRYTVDMLTGEEVIHAINTVSGKKKMLFQAADFQTTEGKFRIISYQNVDKTINKTETEAWQKLLRVLTHEIMNSIAPISSLAHTLHTKLEKFQEDEILHEDIADIKIGVSTILSRSEGLMQFAKSYRSVHKIDNPNFEFVSVLQLLDNLNQLFEPTMIQRNIEFDIVIPQTKSVIWVDHKLIEQVLINLLLNAMDAVKEIENRSIIVSVSGVGEEVQIKVKDNGKGMSKDILEQIFTPFFTTKKAGSGIGLTLSKQIMLLHEGNISINSQENLGTEVVLQFKGMINS